MPENPYLINEENIPSSWSPVAVKQPTASPVIPGQPSAAPLPNEMPQFFSGSMPPQLQHDTSFVGTEVATPGIPKYSLMPFGTQGNPATNAAIQSTSTKVVNITAGVDLKTNHQNNPNQGVLDLTAGSGITLTPDATGQVLISGGGGDGLTHGETPWETDPSSDLIWEDFQNQISASLFGTTYPFTTAALNGGAGTTSWCPNNIPNIGAFYITPPATTANAGEYIVPFVNTNTSVLGSDFRDFLWPLLDYPGWKAVWVFSIKRGSGGFANFTTPFNLTKLSTYVGLGMGGGTAGTAMTGPRPPVFIGARYDTDPGTSYTLSAVANASGGSTVYTGAFSANSVLVGCQVTIAGFANANNNGTFIVSVNTTTTMTVNNPNGVAVTAAGTAATPAISDSTIHLEACFNNYVQSTTSRNNRQGTNGGTFDTGIAPAEGVYYRLEIKCVTAGQVIVSLNNISTTFTVSPVSATSTLGSGSAGAGSGIMEISVAGATYNGCFGGGSIVTVSGLTGSYLPLNGAQTVQEVASGACQFFAYSSATVALTVQQATISYLPALQPFAQCGNDSTGTAPAAGSRALWLDAFGLAWNKGLITGGATPDPTKARYW